MRCLHNAGTDSEAFARFMDFANRYKDKIMGAYWKMILTEIKYAEREEEDEGQMERLMVSAKTCRSVLDRFGATAELRQDEVYRRLIVLPANLVAKYGATLPQLIREVYNQNGTIVYQVL